MRRILGLAMAALLAFGVAACGGDDSSSSNDTSAGSDDGGGGDGGDGGGTDADIAAGFVDEDCQFLLAGLFANPAAATDEETANQLAAVADKAPEEIQGAMEILSSGYAQMTEALEDVDASDPQAYAEALAGLEDVFDEEYEEASQTVSDYVDENCSGG